MDARSDLRVLLFSHDTVGLGHIRRNQAIAFGLAHSIAPTIMMISGTRQSTLFDIPSCVDFVTIPALKKGVDGTYEPRNPQMSLEDTLTLRRGIAQSVVHDFQPDVLIVDKVPLGVYGELEPTLKRLRKEGRTKTVLGLRDILDDPATVARDWGQDQSIRAIDSYYDALWVYGDRRICDQAREYRWPRSVADKIHYLGYLDRSTVESAPEREDEQELAELEPLRHHPFTLCMVGGGEDGGYVASTFASTPMIPGHYGVVLAGPFMTQESRQELQHRAAANPRMLVVDFSKRPDALMQRADRIVAMGGYNTVCEILSREKQALIVPRITPRTEQLIRAERLAELGVIDYLLPDEFNSATLQNWLLSDGPSPCGISAMLDLAGMQNIPSVFMELVSDKKSISNGGLGRGRLTHRFGTEPLALRESL